MLKPMFFAATARVAGALSLSPAHAQNYNGNGWGGYNAGQNDMPNQGSQPYGSYGYNGPNNGYFSNNGYGQGQQQGYNTQNPYSGPGNQNGYNNPSMNANGAPQWSSNSGWDRRAMTESGNYGRPNNSSMTNGQRPDQGVLVLLIEHDRQTQAMRALQDEIQQARQALQSGDKNRAEQALNQADQTIRVATRAGDQGSNQQANGSSGTTSGATSTQTSSTNPSGPNGTSSSQGGLGSSAGTSGNSSQK